MRLLYYIIFICLFISGCIPSKEISIKKKEINPDGLYHSMTEYIISNVASPVFRSDNKDKEI